jgi:DnaK suppressor protein
MILPEIINIASRQIPTMWVIMALGLFYCLFILWYEGRKDGFDEERILDLTFSSFILAGVVIWQVSTFYKRFQIFDPTNMLLKFDYFLLLAFCGFIVSLIPVFIFSRLWSWSKFRVLDIYAVAYTTLLIFLGLGEYLIYGYIDQLALSATMLVLYLGLLRFRGYKFISGLLFSLFLFFTVAIGLIFFRRNGYLLFYPILVTIGVTNLYLRGKTTMLNGHLPSDFLKMLKNKLLAKDKELKVEQKLLHQEDPYLQSNRDEGNAENMDEAILEDSAKEVSDAKLDFMATMRHQIKKALALIKLGKYGVCEICGKPIDKARLGAYPEATTCYECAQKLAEEDSEAQEPEPQG